ncbi:MAG: hypothetical protein ACOCVF_01465 [bacterium]
MVKVENYNKGKNTIIITFQEDHAYLLVPSGFKKKYYVLCHNPYGDITKHHGNIYSLEQIETFLDIKITS